MNNGILVTYYYNKINLKIYRIKEIKYNDNLIYYNPIVNATYDTSKVGEDWTFVSFHTLGISENDESDFIKIISASVYTEINYSALEKVTNYIKEEFEAKQSHKQIYNSKSNGDVETNNNFNEKIIKTACGHNCLSCSACSACSRAFSK